MSNPFDEFDEASPGLPSATGTQAPNPFDEFDAPPASLAAPVREQGVVLPSIKRAGGQIVESL
jgi:hypothetical protein